MTIPRSLTPVPAPDLPSPGVPVLDVPDDGPAAHPLAMWRTAVMLIGLGAWWWPITSAFGGRDAGALTAGLLLLVPVLWVARVWMLPRRHLLALVPGSVAAVALLWMPTRGDGLDEAALWLSAGLIYLSAAGWLAQRGSVWVLLGPVGAGALAQVWAGWWAWFGQGGSASPMVGTFYWHNQFGAFMLAVAVTATGIVVHGVALQRRLVLAIGGVAALAGAGTIFSGSRACVLLLVASFLALAVTCVRVPRRLLSLISLAAAIGTVAWVLTALLPAFAGAGQALASRGQSATGNAAARLDYASAAWQIMRQSPWIGTGADSFGTAAPALVGPFEAPTQWVHNGYLQAFVDAGIAFGLALASCVALVIIVGLRRLIVDDRLLRSPQRLDAVRTGCLLGAGVLAGHAAFDFDWAYPTLAALFAVLSAVVLQASVSTGEQVRLAQAAGRSRLSGSVIGTCVVVALLASSGVDGAAPTGGSVAWWRTVATAGWADGAAPAWLTPVSQCRQQVRVLVEADEPVAKARVETLARCLDRVVDRDVAAAADLRAIGVLATAPKG